jgi:hypothetical protein
METSTATWRSDARDLQVFAAQWLHRSRIPPPGDLDSGHRADLRDFVRLAADWRRHLW